MNLKININKYILALSVVLCNLLSFAQAPDSLKLPFNLGKDDNAPSIDLKDPSNVETKVIYDPVTNQYKIVETIGNNEYRPSDNQDFDDFWENQNKQAETEVLSPTFNIVYEYEISELKIMHYDLYRLKTEKDVQQLGIFNQSTKSIKVIEWAEIIKDKPDDRLEIKISYEKKQEMRKIDFEGFGKWKEFNAI